MKRKPLVLAIVLAALGCRAQTATTSPAAGAKLSPELARRVEIMIRSRSDLPPQYIVNIGDRNKSIVPGYDEITVTFAADGKTSKPLTFLLSNDGKTLAQFNKFDISEDPRLKVSATDRPARGGPANAPVVIVGFDDLECPFCAKLHAQLFPAILERYKEQVRVVYRDFPLEQHPWAMRAAVDANCLGSTTNVGYWNYVDYIHAHAAEIGGDDKTMATATSQLDKLAKDEASRERVSPAEIATCIEKQDSARIDASKKEGEKLGVDSTPVLFINGEKVDGAIPIEYIFRMIDGALVAAGQTPPPPFVPTPMAPASAASTPQVPAKPGN
jgi:protein-disulfide isomerase